MRKWIRLTAILLVSLLCLTACAKSESAEPEAEESASPDLTEGMLILARDGASDYTVVCKEELLEQNLGMQTMLTLSDRLERSTGATIAVRSDAEEGVSHREILIGTVKNRSESEVGMQAISAPDGVGYHVSVQGEKILISCEVQSLLKDALQVLLDAIQECGDGVYGVPKDLCARMDVPQYGTTEPVKVCSTGAGNYTASVSATNYMKYMEYLTKLENDGFVEYSSNRIGRNFFATYVKDTDLESMFVHTMFYEKLFRFEMTYGPLAYLPSTEAVSAPSEGAVTPSVTQIGRIGSTNTAPGMSLVIQLADASFVIFDGGPYVPQDSADLYRFMKERTPEGQKPVIAAWFITHAHGDHMGLATSFLMEYRHEVDLKLGAYNFPDFDRITIRNEGTSSMKSMALSFQSKISSFYPDAEQWVMHTGQKLLLPGCEIEVLYTPEDAGSMVFAWGNHTCTAVRITLNGETIVVLGDAEKTLCQQMANAYGSSIQSDMLSLSHHGFNGACLDLYKYVNPDICFWPVDSQRFTEDPRCTGEQSGYNFNAWLRDNSIKVREHYTADITKTIDCA